MTSSVDCEAPAAPALKAHGRFWSDIAVFGDYLPWNVHKAAGGDRSDYPQHSGRILDLKDGKDAAVTHFADQVTPGLNDGVVIAVVPSHDPKKAAGGLSKLAAALAQKGKNRVDGSAALARTKKISKLAHGGDRNIEVHKDSVTVAKPDLVAGRDVALLDDVTKTGNSLHACRDLLLAAGAKSVTCITLGKT